MNVSATDFSAGTGSDPPYIEAAGAIATSRTTNVGVTTGGSGATVPMLGPTRIVGIQMKL